MFVTREEMRKIVVGGKICIVRKSCEEDAEEYWDRAWAWASSLAEGSPAAAWERSFVAACERRGNVY